MFDPITGDRDAAWFPDGTKLPGGAPTMTTLLRDLRLGVRMLVKHRLIRQFIGERFMRLNR